MDDKQIRRYLSAFADGELDVEQSLQVLERMAMDPQTTRRVLHQQQLRQRVSQTMSRGESKTPEALRRQIASMAERPAAPDQVADLRAASRWAFARRWFPTVLAAALLLAALVTVQFGRDGAGAPSGPEGVAYHDDGGVDEPATIDFASADRFGRRHSRCSRDQTPLFNPERFPTEVTALPAAIEAFLGLEFTGPPLDLSLLGFDYRQAGECLLPGGQAVHVLYRTDQAGEDGDSLSLWIAPDTGQLDLEPDRLYTTADPANTGPPLLIWKHEELVYYLVGDSMPRAHQVAQAMASRR
ncbi:MAG: hypothetical protein WDZ31_05075 [Phycisphaeraceae bacterium]